MKQNNFLLWIVAIGVIAFALQQGGFLGALVSGPLVLDSFESSGWEPYYAGCMQTQQSSEKTTGSSALALSLKEGCSDTSIAVIKQFPKTFNMNQSTVLSVDIYLPDASYNYPKWATVGTGVNGKGNIMATEVNFNPITPKQGWNTLTGSTLDLPSEIRNNLTFVMLYYTANDNSPKNQPLIIFDRLWSDNAFMYGEEIIPTTPQKITLPATAVNGIVESPEECDDANPLDDDGCSSTMKIEPNYECKTYTNSLFEATYNPDDLSSVNDGKVIINTGNTVVGNINVQNGAQTFQNVAALTDDTVYLEFVGSSLASKTYPAAWVMFYTDDMYFAIQTPDITVPMGAENTVVTVGKLMSLCSKKSTTLIVETPSNVTENIAANLGGGGGGGGGGAILTTQNPVPSPSEPSETPEPQSSNSFILIILVVAGFGYYLITKGGK